MLGDAERGQALVEGRWTAARALGRRPAAARSGRRRCPTRGSRRSARTALARRPRGARQPAGAGAGAGLGAGLDQPLRARRRPGLAAGDSRAAGDALDGPCGAADRGSRPRLRRPLLADARGAPALPREGVGLARAGPAAARGARRPGLDRAGAAAPRPCDRARRDGGRWPRRWSTPTAARASRAPEDLAEILILLIWTARLLEDVGPARHGAAPAGDRARGADAEAAAARRRRPRPLPRRRRRLGAAHRPGAGRAAG